VPFPLAHPAAILPLRRWCPAYLDFSALVTGSLTPDLASSIDDWEYFSHTIPGSFLFCLPVGLVTLWIFQRVRAPLVATFPNPHRDALLPLCGGAPASLFRVIISLLLGSWLHIAWDLFTHDYSWLVRRFAVFSAPVAGMPLNHVLWLVSSLAGVGFLLAMYRSLLHKRSSDLGTAAPPDRRAYALWSGILLIPFAGAAPLALHNAGPSYSASTLTRYLAMYDLGCTYLTLAFAGLFFSWRQAARNR